MTLATTTPIKHKDDNQRYGHRRASQVNYQCSKTARPRRYVKTMTKLQQKRTMRTTGAAFVPSHSMQLFLAQASTRIRCLPVFEARQQGHTSGADNIHRWNHQAKGTCWQVRMCASALTRSFQARIADRALNDWRVGPRPTEHVRTRRTGPFFLERQ